jgi:16S rRNA (cytidine1402-2'-O)-methyltransferase
MPGHLYVCATPIGNLDDISVRLGKVLNAVDVVFAEDTRRVRTLLDRVGSLAPATSYFLGNEASRAEELRNRLLDGDSVALVTDAGTLTISDPGFSAVRVAIEAEAEVVPIPGPSAVTAALAASWRI